MADKAISWANQLLRKAKHKQELRLNKLLRLLLASVLVSMLTLVASTTSADVEITEAHVFAPLPGKSMTVAYGTLQNTGTATQQLLAISVPSDNAWAETVEIHEHVHADGMMQMRKLESLSLAAGARQQLVSGGIHLMVFGVRQLADGESLPLVLHWNNGKQQQILVDVRQR